MTSPFIHFPKETYLLICQFVIIEPSLEKRLELEFDKVFKSPLSNNSAKLFYHQTKTLARLFWYSYIDFITEGKSPELATRRIIYYSLLEIDFRELSSSSQNGP